MAGDWQPANALERGLVDAVRRQDQHSYLALLSGVPLLVLVRQDGTGRTIDWLTSITDSQTFLLGYTSPESLAAVAGGRDAPYLTATIEELADRWPDPRWWLAINSGLPVEGLVSPAYLASLTQAAPADSRMETDSRPVTEPLPAEPQPQREPAAFEPANSVERDLLDASRRGDTDTYVRTLLLAEVLVPVADEPRQAATGHAGIPWQTIQAYGEPSIPVFTSLDRLSERLGDVPFRTEEILVLVRNWPDPALALAVNPDTPVGATLPGPQVLELAGWAVGAGLIDAPDYEADELDVAEAAAEAAAEAEPAQEAPAEESTPEAEPIPEAARTPAAMPTPEAETPAAEPSGGPEPDPHADWLQKVLSHEHVSFYRERRYNIVSGHVHRIRDVGQVPPAELYRLLALDSPEFGPNDPHVHVIRWPAHRDGRYGDPDRPVVTGTVPQTRVAAVPLPHGALLCRIDRGAGVTVVASYDADHREWRTATGEERG
ncbi:MAG TPA: SseB family protein [Micromonosporaceae bacterium]